MRPLFIYFFFVAIILFQVGSVIVPRLGTYSEPYYTDAVYKSLESAFNYSQYRQKNPLGIIPDETVFSYAAGAYLRGVDPILINSEHTPLGKYFLSLSILLFKNDKLLIPVFAALALVSLWLVGREVLHSGVIALLPVLIFSTEKLFLGQITVVPLLDIIQLPFILLSFYVFLKEEHSRRYWMTGIMLGLVAATKSAIPAFLLIATFSLYFILYKKFKSFVRFLLSLLLTLGVLIASYTRTFMDGYTLIDFIGFQKWIILYQKSKLLFPFSVWRLVFLNQWQAWWGDMSILKAEDWQITWPVFTGLTVLLILFLVFKKIKATREITLLSIWFIVYGAFLSIGVVSSRFLLPLLPVTYMLGIWLFRFGYMQYHRNT